MRTSDSAFDQNHHTDPATELSVVLPVRNERNNLEQLDQELRSILAKTKNRCEVIYIDDNSSDGSSTVLKGFVEAAKGKPIRTRVASLRRCYGQTAALSAGIDLAEGKTLITLDADGQNNPADIPRLLKKLDEGYDVVNGWRTTRKDRLFSRRMPSFWANRLISRIAGVPLHDFGCTLKAYRTSLLQEVRLYGDMHRFIPIFLAYQGARVTELEVDHRPRRFGVSKYGGDRVLKVLVDLVLVRFMTKSYTRPMQFFGKIGAWFFLAALFVGMSMVALKYGWLELIGFDYRASFIETPLPSLAATFFLGTINSLFFGILGEILIRIHHESGGFRAYAVRRIDDSLDEPG